MTKLLRVLLGRHTVDYLRRRREARQYRPVDKLTGPSRWEALDSDGPNPGPYAMRDELAGELMASEVYQRSLDGLRSSYVYQPVRLGDGADGAQGGGQGI